MHFKAVFIRQTGRHRTWNKSHYVFNPRRGWLRCVKPRPGVGKVSVKRTYTPQTLV